MSGPIFLNDLDPQSLGCKVVRVEGYSPNGVRFEHCCRRRKATLYVGPCEAELATPPT